MDPMGWCFLNLHRIIQKLWGCSPRAAEWFMFRQILVRWREMGGTPVFSYSTPKKIPKTWKAGTYEENIIYTTSCKHMSILSGGCYKPIFLQVSVRSNARPCRVRQRGAGDVAAEQFLQDRRMMNCKSWKYGIWLIWFASMNYHTWWWIYNNKTLINYCISILQYDYFLTSMNHQE